jgi:hypothetical protein
MKSDLEILESLNKAQVPADPLPMQQNETEGSLMGVGDDESVVDSCPVPYDLLCFPLATVPLAMQQLTASLTT